MVNRKIKVLFVMGNLRPSNGVTSFAMTYFRNLDHSKIQVDFALLNDVKSPYYNEIRRLGSKIYILPPLKRMNDHLKKCRQILQENDYQVIHDNILIASLPIMYCAYRSKIPVRILQSHNTRLSSIKWKAKRNRLLLPLLRMMANQYFACGKIAGKAMFGNAKFKVIPNAIAFKSSYFSAGTRHQVRAKYNCQDKIVVGTVGRLSLQKNPFFAIKVIEKLVKKHSNIQYWWIGSGELDDQVKKYINDKHLTNYIKLFGSCDDIYPLYQAMDAFFLPSLFEGLPITAIEAQSTGLPCIISDSVTKELVYTDLVDFVPLDSHFEVWDEHILKQVRRTVNRYMYKNAVKNSQYYAPNAAKLLLNYYSTLINESRLGSNLALS